MTRISFGIQKEFIAKFNKQPIKNNEIAIRSDELSRFSFLRVNNCIPFKWMGYACEIPDCFIKKVNTSFKPAHHEILYFNRFSMHTPTKPSNRKSIEIPFSADDDDNLMYCNFNNDGFAAYIMGTAGSGKSVLLDVIICGLLMNYHPDELELWLLDFNMIGFKRYMNQCPPHVRYILLENSEELVFNIIDQLSDQLKKGKNYSVRIIGLTLLRFR